MIVVFDNSMVCYGSGMLWSPFLLRHQRYFLFAGECCGTSSSHASYIFFRLQKMSSDAKGVSCERVSCDHCGVWMCSSSSSEPSST